MKPRPFDYVRAESLQEALDCLAQHGDAARVLAGGQSQVAMLNFRLLAPEVLIDITEIDDLRYIRVDGNALEVGAAVTQAELKDWPQLEEMVPLLHAALPFVGHYQTRSRGTVCGSIAHSDPSSELPLVLATLGGEVVLQSADGRRVADANQFQVGILTTSRRPDEMVTSARFPVGARGGGYAFDEFARRKGDFAIVCVAAAVTDSVIRLGIGGVADRPEVRDWNGLGEADLDDALNDFAWDLGGYDDIHATSRYRRELVRRLGRRTIEMARQCRA